MSKLRSVSTGFWSDPFIEDLTPNQKLLFLYLITNEKTNMLGIYEASIKKISFETDIKKDVVQDALKLFEKKGKVRYADNFVIITNYLKHQNFNTNMKKSAIDTYNNLPNELKDSNLNVTKDNPLEGFERLLNHFGMVSKREVEYEYELEVKDETKKEDKLVFPFDSKKFLEVWELWIKYRNQSKKPIKGIIAEQAQLQKISKLANLNEEIAIEIIMQSIENNWTGIFELKNNNNGNNKTDSRTTSNRVSDILNQQSKYKNTDF